MFYGIHMGTISQATVTYNEFEKCTFKITATSHRDLMHVKVKPAICTFKAVAVESVLTKER